MPPVSKKQRSLFCIAKSIKEGKTPASFSKQAAKIAENTDMKTINEFCESPVSN